jgi:hypothetical protein
MVFHMGRPEKVRARPAKVRRMDDEFTGPGLQASCFRCLTHLVLASATWPEASDSPVKWLVRPDFHLVDGIWQRPIHAERDDLQVRDQGEHIRQFENGPESTIPAPFEVDCPKCGSRNRVDAATLSG